MYGIDFELFLSRYYISYCDVQLQSIEYRL